MQPIPSGRIQSIPGFEPQLDAEIISGSDKFYLDPDGANARANVKGIAKLVSAPVHLYRTVSWGKDEKSRTTEGSVSSFYYNPARAPVTW